ncbi:MAG: DUF2911 domain-containing protein [Candidatus Hydrogenedentota bacterium]
MKARQYSVGFLMAGLAALAMSFDASAQDRKKAKPDASQGASVSQVIGADTTITIDYHRPGLKGRDVWKESSTNPAIGKLVPFDENPLPWRAGANEATTIEVSADVLVEGQPLPAGKYALFMIPTESGEWSIVFNKTAKQWGAFRYDKTQDALRVKVKVAEAPAAEWLVFGFDNPADFSVTAYLHWEKVMVPFKIETAKK